MYRGDREILEETLDEAERPLTVRWPSSEAPSEPSYDCSFRKNVTVHGP